MLSDDEDDFAPAMPAPTTAPLPKASKKNLRKSKVCFLPELAVSQEKSGSRGCSVRIVRSSSQRPAEELTILCAQKHNNAEVAQPQPDIFWRPDFKWASRYIE